jgi:DNA primase
MKSTIDDLLGRINILDIVSPYVKLRRTGKNYVGLCPFHKEKTPSFSVSTEKQIYYCFGCQEGGNAINFLMKYENLNFQEALENLGRQYGVEVTRKGGARKGDVFDALGKLADYYHKGLNDSRAAVQYLAKRGIDNEAVEEFKIGYSDRRSNIKDFLKVAAMPNDLLISTGIVRVKEGDVYDIFRGRVVIPILDVNRKVIGFGGRAIEEGSFPKYINSPESPVFSKGSSLFGIDKTKKHIADENEVFIVEGYFDFIALYMNGFRNVVSTLGTAVTEGQLSRLRNYTDNITLLLDGDEAGIKSALRLIGLFSEMNINGNMIVLPQGHDPDSFVRKEGVEAVRKAVEGKKPILDHFFEYQMKKKGIGTLEGKMTFIEAVMPYVEGIRDGVKRRLYIKRLSQLTGVEEVHFGDDKRERRSESLSITDDSASTIGRKVVGVLMNNPHLLEVLRGREVIEYIDDSSMKEVLLKMSGYFEENRRFELTGFINFLEKAELRSFVLNASFDVADFDEEEPDRIVWDYVRHIEGKFHKERLKKITERLSEAEKRGDEKVIMELMQEKRKVLASIKTNSVR